MTSTESMIEGAIYASIIWAIAHTLIAIISTYVKTKPNKDFISAKEATEVSITSMPDISPFLRDIESKIKEASLKGEQNLSFQINKSPREQIEIRNFLNGQGFNVNWLSDGWVSLWWE